MHIICKCCNIFVLELWAFYNFFSAQKREVLGVHRLALLESAHSRTAVSCRCVGRPIRQTVNGWRQQFSSGHNNVPGTNFDSTPNKTLLLFQPLVPFFGLLCLPLLVEYFLIFLFQFNFIVLPQFSTLNFHHFSFFIHLYS